MDNKFRVNVHVYVVQDWRKVPILLSLEHVVDHVGGENMTKLINGTLITRNALNKEKMMWKLVSFGIDGVVMFWDICINVTIHIQEKYVPYMLSVHCMAHRMNLVIQVLNHLSFICRLYVLLVATIICIFHPQP